MPTIKIGYSKVVPFYPENSSARRSHFTYIASNSQGQFLLENPEVVQDDYNWWSTERLPTEDSDRRIRINARTYNEAIQQLSEHNLERFTRLDHNNISSPKNIIRLIIIAFNTYSHVKLHYIEEAPRTRDGRIIGYHVDYINIRDNHQNDFKDVFQGRCMVTLDSDTIRDLLYEISKNNWESFWIKITGLYETIFNRYNAEIDEPKHIKIKYSRTKLETEYIQRKQEDSSPIKEEIIHLLENIILPTDAYEHIMNILKKDPQISEEKKKELELC